MLKQSPTNRLLEAVRVVSAGGSYIDAALVERSARKTEESESPRAPSVSEREKQVLRMMAIGHSNKEIAERSTSASGRSRFTRPTRCASSGFAGASMSCASRFFMAGCKSPDGATDVVPLIVRSTALNRPCTSHGASSPVSSCRLAP